MEQYIRICWCSYTAYGHTYLSAGDYYLFDVENVLIKELLVTLKIQFLSVKGSR